MIVKLILYPFFLIISLVFPRNKSIWIFGNKKGYSDNTKYFFEFISNYAELKSLWLANNDLEAYEITKLGYSSIPKNSLKGMWFASRASFSFICNGHGDLNRLLILRSTIINFWHGTPIKLVCLDAIQLQQNNMVLKILVYFQYLLTRSLYKTISAYYLSNEYEKKTLSKATKVPPEKFNVIGSPRFDIIRSAPVPDIIDYLSQSYKIILFAPTWRNNDQWSTSHKISDEDYQQLNNTLKTKKTILLVHLHPFTKKSNFLKTGLLPSDNIIYTDSIDIYDINLIYKSANGLITDLSSVIFDYLIVNNKYLLFIPDYSIYLSNRDIYTDFKKIISDIALTNWKDLIIALNKDNWSSMKLFNEISTDAKHKINCSENIALDISRKFNVSYSLKQ